MNRLRQKKYLLALLLLVIVGLVALYTYTNRAGTDTAAAEVTDASSVPHDSSALHLSLIPSMGTLPFYYAVRSGMADSTTVRLALHTTYAQPDANTAILRGAVDLALLPLTYLSMQTADKVPLVAVMAVPEQWHLIATKQLRATAVSKLKGKAVATTRYGAGDYWLQAALNTQKLTYDDVYHPQINAVDVRLHMVANNQIDATMLPEPWANMAIQNNCKSLWHTSTSEAQQWALTTRARSLNSKKRREQISQAITLYNRACEALNQPENALRDSLLMSLFGLTAEAVQTLPRWQWTKAHAVRQGDVKASIEFLQGRGIATRTNTRTELYTNSFIPE